MSDDAGNPVDAFGGLVLLAFDLLDSEISRSPDRLIQTFKSPTLLQAAEKAMLSFAKSRGPFASSQLTPEEIGKLQSSVVDGVRTAAPEAYLKQIKSSSKFKALETQLKNFEEAAKSYQNNPTALHLRAMNMLYEGLKEKGALMLIPSSAVESMGLGGMLGAAALQQQRLTESGGSNSTGKDRP